MADRQFSDDDLRLYELLQQFLCLSDDTEHAGTLILVGPNGSIVGDVKLSALDIETATDALLGANIRRADAAEGLVPAEPLPELDSDDAGQVDAMVTALENIANGGQA